MSNRFEQVGVLILAAGQGTRMKSDKAKVLHEIAGRPMIHYVMEAACKVAGSGVVMVVVGHQAELVKRTIRQIHDPLFALQQEQLGTGHAVACGLERLPPSVSEVLILYGDVPLLTDRTLSSFLEEHFDSARDVSVLAAELENPFGYGRIILDKAQNVVAIVEEKDATEAQKAIHLINTGIYCVKRGFLDTAIQRLSPDNAQQEYYLTDIVAIAHEMGKLVGAFVGDHAAETMGVNTVKELEKAQIQINRWNVVQKEV